MTSKELVKRTMNGEPPGRTPLYGWVQANLNDPICKQFGSVEAFEDHYRFDLAHIFCGPRPFCREVLQMAEEGQQITPQMLLQYSWEESCQDQ